MERERSITTKHLWRCLFVCDSNSLHSDINSKMRSWGHRNVTAISWSLWTLGIVSGLLWGWSLRHLQPVRKGRSNHRSLVLLSLLAQSVLMLTAFLSYSQPSGCLSLGFKPFCGDIFPPGIFMLLLILSQQSYCYFFYLFYLFLAFPQFILGCLSQGYLAILCLALGHRQLNLGAYSRDSALWGGVILSRN